MQTFQPECTCAEIPMSTVVMSVLHETVAVERCLCAASQLQQHGYQR